MLTQMSTFLFLLTVLKYFPFLTVSLNISTLLQMMENNNNTQIYQQLILMLADVLPYCHF